MVNSYCSSFSVRGANSSGEFEQIRFVISFDTRCKDTQFLQNKTQETNNFAISSINFEEIHSKYSCFRKSYN